MSDLNHDQLCRIIVDRSGDAIMYADRNGVIRLWNDGAVAMFGFSTEEAVGQSLDIIIPENLRKRHWDGYFRIMDGGDTRYATELLAVPALCRDGQRLSSEFSMTLVRDESGAILGVAAIIRDVTARWQREKSLKERLAALEKQQL